MSISPVMEHELSAIRRAMSAAMFRMFDEVKKLRETNFGDFKQIETWLKTECRLPKDDISTYEMFEETLGKHRPPG